MTRRTVSRLSFAGIVLARLTVPILGQSDGKPLTFDVAIIKPSAPGTRGGGIRALPGGQTYIAQGAPLRLMIMLMYKLTNSQIAGGPSWIDTDRWDVEAKAEKPTTLDNLHLMFQNMLADQFQLQFHREKREMQAYVLTVDKSGSKMKLNDSPEPFDVPLKGQGRGKMSATHMSMQYFSWTLGNVLQQPVVDQTGLDKFYDFTLEFMPDPPPGAAAAGPDGRGGPPAGDGPSIFTALREQLGLRLESKKAPVETLVIDHVEKPKN